MQDLKMMENVHSTQPTIYEFAADADAMIGAFILQNHQHFAVETVQVHDSSAAGIPRIWTGFENTRKKAFYITSATPMGIFNDKTFMIADAPATIHTLR